MIANSHELIRCIGRTHLNTLAHGRFSLSLALTYRAAIESLQKS